MAKMLMNKTENQTEKTNIFYDHNRMLISTIANGND